MRKSRFSETQRIEILRQADAEMEDMNPCRLRGGFRCDVLQVAQQIWWARGVRGGPARVIGTQSDLDLLSCFSLFFCTPPQRIFSPNCRGQRAFMC